MRNAGALLLFVAAGAGALACGLDVSGAAYFAGGTDEAGVVGGGEPAGEDAATPSSDGSTGGSLDGGAGGEGDASVAPDAPPLDASADSAAAPDASCAAYCNGQCVASCAGCSAGQALCASTRQCGDCSSCTDGNGAPRPIACFSCDANRQNPVGTCEPNDRAAYCLSANYGNGHHCGCGNYDVSLCPGNNQVCIDDGQGVAVCITCGEPGTDNYDCNAGKCHANGAAVPACK